MEYRPKNQSPLIPVDLTHSLHKCIDQFCYSYPYRGNLVFGSIFTVQSGL